MADKGRDVNAERRRFLEAVSLLAGGLGAAVAAVPVIGFALGPMFGARRTAWRTVGTLGQFPVGQTVPVRFEAAAETPWDGVTARDRRLSASGSCPSSSPAGRSIPAPIGRSTRRCSRGERSWRRRPWAPAVVLVAATMIGVLWRAGVQVRWTSDFGASPLPAQVAGVASGPAFDGVAVFNTRGCLFCHRIAGHGGTRGPDLTLVGDRLTRTQLTVRVLNGGYNMPAYANNISPTEMADLVAFLASRTSR